MDNVHGNTWALSMEIHGQSPWKSMENVHENPWTFIHEKTGFFHGHSGVVSMEMVPILHGIFSMLLSTECHGKSTTGYVI